MSASITSRRQFLQAASSIALLGLVPRSVSGQGLLVSNPRKWTANLVGGAIGVNVGQKEIIELAAKHGFESVEARPEELAAMSADDLQAVVVALKEAGLRWGTAGLPVEFRQDDATFEGQLKELPAQARALQAAGVKRVSTWIMPTHADLTYLQNFERHASRLRRVAQILEDHDQRLGMEYVGTQTLLIRERYPFIHTLAELQELMVRIGTGNVGVVLDSWHWWTAGDSADAIRALKNEEVILVDLNDAPKGVDREEQLDGNRQLPASTGVIPVDEFLGALVAIGYDGPVRAEPFNQTLNDLGDDAACEATIHSLRRAFQPYEQL